MEISSVILKIQLMNQRPDKKPFYLGKYPVEKNDLNNFKKEQISIKNYSLPSNKFYKIGFN